MPSYTSSSNIRVPRLAPRLSLVAGFFIAIAILSLIEFGLLYHGMKPQLRDTKELWSSQRARASVLGKEALILVGASRIQLGIDLEIIESLLQLTAVQLAIDGSSFLPVLEDLAADPSISGTIIVSLVTGAINKSEQRSKSTEWVEYYNREYKGLFSPVVENNLKDKLKSLSNIYSSGIPLHRLLSLASGREPTPTKSYLITDARRERDADYMLVEQPKFYLDRARRHLGQDVVDLGGGAAQQIQIIRSYYIPKKSEQILHPTDFTYINKLTKRLYQKGCRVIFVRFPSSGLVWEIDQARTPKEYNWDQFAKYSIAPTIHFMDYPELQYKLADGSHLGQRQKLRFTRSLATIIRQKLKGLY